MKGLMLFIGIQAFALSEGYYAPVSTPPAPVRNADILILGDSHSTGCFGLAVFDRLRNMPIGSSTGAATRFPIVSLDAIGGATATSWEQGWDPKYRGMYSHCFSDANRAVTANSVSGRCVYPFPVTNVPAPLDQVISGRPKVSIVALGTNILLQVLRGQKEMALTSVQGLITKIKSSGSECIWVGAPQAGTSKVSIVQYERFESELRALVEKNGQCKYVSSSNKTNRGNLNANEGLHYACDSAEKWGKAVAKEIEPAVSAVLSKAYAAGSSLKPAAAPAAQ